MESFAEFLTRWQNNKSLGNSERPEKEVVFEIHYKDGSKVKLSGKTFQEAYSQNGRRTEDGNIDFSILDWYVNAANFPIPVEIDPETYQIFLLKDAKSNWEPFGKQSDNFGLLESLMKFKKIGQEGFLSGLVIRMSDEKIMSWAYSNDVVVGTF